MIVFIENVQPEANVLTFHGSFYHPALRSEEYLPQVVAYYYKQWDGFDMPFHQHLAVEVMYVISGTCVVETEDGRHEMRKGEFIFLDSNVPHRLIVTKGNPCRMLNLEFVFQKSELNEGFPSMRTLISGSPELQRFLSQQATYSIYKDPSEIYQILRSLITELDDTTRESEWTVQLLLAQLLIRLAKLLGKEVTEPKQQQIAYVQEALEYMHQHYDYEMKVEDIAAAVNVHPGYLHRIFKQQIGRTPVQYLTDFRMEKAKMLLENTSIPVSDIADYVGLNSRQYFSSLFKKYTGRTPLEHRRLAESWVRDESLEVDS